MCFQQPTSTLATVVYDYADKIISDKNLKHLGVTCSLNIADMDGQLSVTHDFSLMRKFVLIIVVNMSSLLS